MTISSEVNKNVYTGTGAVSVYAYTFRIFANTDLEVVEILISTGVETVLTLTVDYTVSGVGDTAGNVTLVAGNLPATKKLAIRLNAKTLQETDYKEHDPYPSETLERSLDKQANISKTLKEEINRSVQSPITETTPLIIPALDANKFLSNDGADLLWTALSTTDYNGSMLRGLDAGKAATPGVGDIYIATDTKRVYLCFVAGTWSVSNHFYGLDAGKAAVPIVGEVYVATDTGRTYVCYVAGTWRLTNYHYGLDASKSATPDVGEIYFATDTGILYRCVTDDAWSVFSTESVKKIFTETAHGFVAGNVVMWNGTNWVKAKADSESNTRTPWVVDASVTANTFRATLSGYISGLSGLTSGVLYYLSEATAGLLTSTEPSGLGEVSKPVLRALSTTTGTVLNQRSEVLAGTGVYELISETVLGAPAATVTISGIPGTYRNLRLIAQVRRDNAAVEVLLGLRFNGDSGNNYDYNRLYFWGASNATIGSIPSNNISCGYVETSFSTANAFSSVIIDIPGYASTSWLKNVLVNTGLGRDRSAGDLQWHIVQGSWRNTAAISSITFLPTGAAGDFITGCTFQLYGIK